MWRWTGRRFGFERAVVAAALVAAIPAWAIFGGPGLEPLVGIVALLLRLRPDPLRVVRAIRRARARRRGIQPEDREGRRAERENRRRAREGAKRRYGRVASER